MIRLVIDTDPGVDDAHAIMAAAAHPAVHIEALTAVKGNVALKHTAANACKILDIMESEATVYAGCALPLIAPPSDASEFHGRDGLGNSNLPPSPRPIAEEHAVQALIRMANAAPGELTLLAIGPLTNVAMATRLDPELPQKYRELVVMGGSIRGMGNATPAAEFNLYTDPEAAAIVFSTWPQLTLLSWETTMAHTFSPQQVDALWSMASPRAEFFRRVSQNTLDFINHFLGDRFLLEPDLLAAAVAIEPDIVKTAEWRHVEIELAGVNTRGQTTVDWFDRTGKDPNVKLVLEMDTDRVWEMLKAALE
ncbi:MAG: nucleoside hydrolase [Anaerolineae bacterium]|nr:nucleoside hydrolase [Anaerolineae bacterium]